MCAYPGGRSPAVRHGSGPGCLDGPRVAGALRGSGIPVATLRRPLDEFAAWVLTPLVLALSSWGVGLLLERAAATRLEGGLVLPVGFAGSIVLLTLPFTVGLGAPFAFVLLVIAAAAGGLLARDHL